jgi:hypothetical protein
VAAERRRWRPPDFARYCLQTCSRRVGLQQCRSFVEMCIVSYLSAAPACVYGRGTATWGCPCRSFPCCRDSPVRLYRSSCGWLFVWLAVVSSADGLYAGVLQRVRVGLGPVLASRAPSPPAAAAASWLGQDRVPIAGWSLGRIGPDRCLRGEGGGVRSGQGMLGPSYFFMSLVLGPLNSLLWYVPSSRCLWCSAPVLFLQEQIKDHHHCEPQEGSL